jgi:hypothetical protein
LHTDMAPIAGRLSARGIWPTPDSFLQKQKSVQDIAFACSIYSYQSGQFVTESQFSMYARTIRIDFKRFYFHILKTSRSSYFYNSDSKNLIIVDINFSKTKSF